MTGRTVLVTGVTRVIGSSLAGRLAAHPAVDRVIGVDAVLPEPAARARMGAAEFARADIRSPVIARVLEAAGVDTVVHASASSTPAGSAARSMAKEMNVLGTMQLLAACQRSPQLRHLVVRSTDAVYGGSSRDPAVVTESTQAHFLPATGRARDAVDIEGYVRGFGRRRPDVRVVVPRFAAIIGPTVRTPLTRYFSLSPFVPVLAGRDARLQLVHEDDAVALMEHLVLGDYAGTVNVAGDGVLSVVQAIHRAGRLPLPIPSAALGGVGRALSLLGVSGFSISQVRDLAAGRVLDTSRLHTEFGFRPRFTTVAAFDDFVAGLTPGVSGSSVRAAEKRIAAVVGTAPLPVAAPPPGTAEDPAVISADPPPRPRLVSIPGDRAGRTVAPRRGTRPR
jgi:UDP-glucose 4-epimerase